MIGTKSPVQRQSRNRVTLCDWSVELDQKIPGNEGFRSFPGLGEICLGSFPGAAQRQTEAVAGLRGTQPGVGPCPSARPPRAADSVERRPIGSEPLCQSADGGLE